MITTSVADGVTPADNAGRRMLTRVAFATMVGSAIEAFDFLGYGTAAALVFNKLFFPNFDPAVGTLVAFGSFAARRRTSLAIEKNLAFSYSARWTFASIESTALVT